MSSSLPVRAELRDPTERVVEDDQGAHRAAEFRDRALLNQRLRAQLQPQAQPGVCTNCGEACMPLAVYCDANCKSDHEWRLGQQRRVGARG